MQRILLGIIIFMNTLDKEIKKAYIEKSTNIAKSMKDILSGKRNKHNKLFQDDLELLGISQFEVSFISADNENQLDSMYTMLETKLTNSGIKLYNHMKVPRKTTNDDNLNRSNKMSDTMKNRILIHNYKGTTISVTPEEYEEKYANDPDWKRGRASIKKLWMNNGINSIQVPSNEIPEYKEKGYAMGKIVSSNS